MNGQTTLPIVPLAEIYPNANDLTTVGNISEAYTYKNAQANDIINLFT
jgi:hypothetical protein